MISWRGDPGCRVASVTTLVNAFEFAGRTASSYLKPTTFPLGAAHTYELPHLFPGFHDGTAGLPVALTPPARETLRRDDPLLDDRRCGIPVKGIAAL